MHGDLETLSKNIDKHVEECEICSDGDVCLQGYMLVVRENEMKREQQSDTVGDSEGSVDE